MHTLKIKHPFAAKMKKGYPLIEKEAVSSQENGIKEGSLIRVADENGTFLGKGYYGEQNKGIGWILTRNEEESIDQSFFLSRLANAFQARKSLFQDPDTTAFRLFNGEGDGIGGFTIDYYDGYYLFQWYSKGIYTFKEAIMEALDELTDYKAVYEKKRFNTAGQYVEDDDFVRGERGEFPIIVKENGIHFAVYLNDGAMTGVFLDQRHVRKAVRDRYAEGKPCSTPSHIQVHFLWRRRLEALKNDER